MYDNQFEDFNPLQKKVPPFPSSELPRIAERALSFLNGMPVGELISRSHALDLVLMELQGLNEKNDKGEHQFQFVMSDFDTLRKHVEQQNTETVRQDFALIAMWRVIDALRIGMPLVSVPRHIDSSNLLVMQPRPEDFDRLHGASAAMFEAGEAVAYAESLQGIVDDKTARAKAAAAARAAMFAKKFSDMLEDHWKDPKIYRATAPDAARLLCEKHELGEDPCRKAIVKSRAERKLSLKR